MEQVVVKYGLVVNVADKLAPQVRTHQLEHLPSNHRASDTAKHYFWLLKMYKEQKSKGDL